MTERAKRWRRVLLPTLPLVTIFAVMAVTGSTAAAFTDSGTSTASTFSAGTVALTNNDTGTANLTFTGLQPGASGSKCYLVSSTGTAPASVRMYLSTYTATNNVGAYINFTVIMGTGTSQSCSDFTALSSGSVINNSSLLTASYANTYPSGLGSWALTGTPTETRTYQISWSVSALAPASTQNSTATVGLTWQARTA